MNRSDMRTQIFRMLGEVDPASPVYWGANDLNDAIAIAVSHFSEISPQRQRTICGIQREVHKVDDDSNTITAADATDLASVITLLNELGYGTTSGDYNVHRASTTYHRAADTTNIVAATIASDLATSLTLATELIADINAHMIESGVHMVDDTVNTITELAPVDLTTVKAVANKIKEKYNAHLDEETDGRTVYVNAVVGDSSFIRLEGIEYPANKYPAMKPLFDYVTGNFLFLKTDYMPGDTGELVFVFWHKKHTFSDSVSTIPIEYENVIALGGEGYALLLRSLEHYHQAATDIGTAKTETAKMITGGAVTLADVDTALDKVTTHTGEADAALDKVTTYMEGASDSAKALLAKITTDIADLRTAIKTAEDAANAALDSMSFSDVVTHLTAASTALGKVITYLENNTNEDSKSWLTKITTDIASLRTAIGTAVDAANTYLDEVDTTDLQGAEAVWADLVKHVLTASGIPNVEDFIELGDDKILTVNIGEDVAGHYNRYAETALNMAKVWGEKRDAFLEEARSRTNAAQGFISEADRRLINLRTYIEQAGGWGKVASGFVEEATQRIAEANAIVNREAGISVQARGYLEEVDRRLANLRGYIEEAGGWGEVALGFVKEATERIGMANAFVNEAAQRLGGLDIYGKEAEAYRNSASRLMEVAQRFREDGERRIRDFFAKLEQIKKIRRHQEKPQNWAFDMWTDDYATSGLSTPVTTYVA